MTVHLFGATSSPGCSNFVLKSSVNDNDEKEIGSTAVDFYVDNGLKSMPSVEEAAKLVQDAKEMCRRGQTVYKRVILLTVSSTINPLVFVASYLLEDKMILQELCKEDTDGMILFPLL